MRLHAPPFLKTLLIRIFIQKMPALIRCQLNVRPGATGWGSRGYHSEKEKETIQIFSAQVSMQILHSLCFVSVGCAVHAAAAPFPIHIVTMFSLHQRPLFDIWWSQVTNAVEVGSRPVNNREFRLISHAEIHEHNTSLGGKGICCDEKWVSAVNRKVHLVYEISKKCKPDSIVIFSDIDVMFFDTSVTTLIEHHLDSGNDITFMSRKLKHRSFKNPGVNTGFFLLTVRENTLQFMREWAKRVGRNDQDTVNSWFSHWELFEMPFSATCQGIDSTCPDHKGMPGVGIFPVWLAASSFNDISSTTAIYHVNGRVSSAAEPTGTSAKVVRLQEAIDVKDRLRSTDAPH
jgi:hypothetical protein